MIAFFKYAIDNNYIWGPTGQILTGIVLGLFLFYLGHYFYKTNGNWSVALFGGAIFTEFLSLAFGALYYEIINLYLAFFGFILFTLIGLMISIKYDSLIISYFSLIGGFLVVLLSGVDSKLFLFLYLMIFVTVILFMSFYKNWTSIRVISYFIMMIYQFSNFNSNYFYF